MSSIQNMSRKSFGADIFSPIRFNASLDDSSLNADGSISEFCSVFAGSKTDNEKLLQIVSADSCELQRKKPVGISNTADKENKNGNLCHFAVEINSSPMNNELTKNGQITVRRSLRNKEKDSEKHSKERSSTKKNSKKNLFLPESVTVRRGSREYGEHKKSSCKNNVDILPSHSDTLEGFKMEVPTMSSSNYSEDSSRLLGMNSSSSVDCSTQTDLTAIELQTIMKKSLEFSGKREWPLSSLAVKNEPSGAPASQPAQIQANIMEKLVRGIVDPECCEIRQILYLHHLANSKLLFKILDELEEGRSKELLKENQQLRIENRQLRIENQQIRNENIQLRKIHIVR